MRVNRQELVTSQVLLLMLLRTFISICQDYATLHRLNIQRYTLAGQIEFQIMDLGDLRDLVIISRIRDDGFECVLHIAQRFAGLSEFCLLLVNDRNDIVVHPSPDSHGCLV